MLLPQRFPYHRNSVVIVALIMSGANIFIASVIFSLSENWPITLVLSLLFFSIVLVFTISPLLTVHEVGEDYILLHQGWYYKKRIALKDITLVKKVTRGPFSYGTHWLWDGTIYVNGSRGDLIFVEENGKDRRHCYRALFDVVDRDGFLRAMKVDPIQVQEIAQFSMSGMTKEADTCR